MTTKALLVSQTAGVPPPSSPALRGALQRPEGRPWPTLRRSRRHLRQPVHSLASAEPRPPMPLPQAAPAADPAAEQRH
eukprot:scaffold34_cov260-Pinguiococcus_pyrenoidosus.AAC.45